MQDAQEAVPRLHPQLDPVFSTLYGNFEKSHLGASVLQTRSLTSPGAHIDRVAESQKVSSRALGSVGET